MRLSVIGCGRLGAVHAACMADIGHEVLGVDINEVKTKILNSGKAWFHEPGGLFTGTSLWLQNLLTSGTPT